MEKKKIIKIVLIVVLIIVVCDQLTKFLASTFVTEKVGGEHIYLEVTENTGMAFGFNDGNGRNIILSIFVIVILVSFLKNQKDELDTKTVIAISLTIGGGISNIIDRIFRGGVLDFIKILFIPTFNIADICVIAGWLMVVIFLVVYSRKDISEEMNETERIKQKEELFNALNKIENQDKKVEDKKKSRKK